MLDLGNLNPSGVKTALQLLQESEYKFVLTGSRRFRCHRDSSDYDLFVEDSKEVRLWLSSNGFKKLIEGDPKGYDIPNTVIYRKENVDVQVRENFERFVQVNRWFDERPKAYMYLKGLERSERNAMWRFLMTFL